MKISKKKITCVFTFLLISVVFSGCISEQKPTDNSAKITIPGFSGSMSANIHELFASFYKIEAQQINAQGSTYTLPLNINEVTNNEQINQEFQLTPKQKDLLEKNGFVVIPYYQYESMIALYENIKQENIPFFISADAVLHVYHILFDQMLKTIENETLYEDILDLTWILLNASKDTYETSTNIEIKEAAKRNIGFFSVGLALLSNQSTDLTFLGIPDEIHEQIKEELTYISQHEGFSNSPLFIYREDYSQYIPRGHYTESDRLKQYFKTMMWYGRMSFLLKGGEPYCQDCDYLISAEDAKIQTLQACLISLALPSLRTEQESLEDIWNRVYTITSFFVGTADDLTPYQYHDAMQQVFGETLPIDTDLVQDSKLFELRSILATLPSPKIYGGTGEIALVKPPGSPFTIEDLEELLEKTKGMRLMGQRFILDSYIFQQLVFPAVDQYLGTSTKTPFTYGQTAGGPTRAFPRGLDAMAALGSHLAYKILEEEGDTQYKDYDTQLTQLQKNISTFNITSWNRNLYMSWLYTLQACLEPLQKGYPAFMQTDAWAKKTLATALASWTELRHDTILYAKQSYTPLKATIVNPTEQEYIGFVEPIPLLYTRLLALTKMTREGLEYLSVIQQKDINRFTYFEIILQTLLNFSIKELEQTPLSNDEYKYIANFDETLESVLSGLDDQGIKTTLVADVHTDTNSQQVLEEAVGYIHAAIVVFSKEESLWFAAGPVFSYYEFKHPMNDRLTDETWKELLTQEKNPAPPVWTSTFYTK